jgi:hypothetical protein
VDLESLSLLLPSTDMSGFTHGNLVLKDGKYYLVFETVVTCPHCKENFFLDLWLPTLIPT